MLMGWATGMAHLDRNSASPGLAWLNITGVALALLALALYTLIRPDAANDRPAAMRDELLLQAGGAGAGVLGGAGGETRARRSRRLSGLLMAVLSGVLYGNNFTPPNLLLNTGRGPSNAPALFNTPREGVARSRRRVKAHDVRSFHPGQVTLSTTSSRTSAASTSPRRCTCSRTAATSARPPCSTRASSCPASSPVSCGPPPRRPGSWPTPRSRWRWPSR